MAPEIGMTIPQMQQAARDGAYIEFVYSGTLGPNLKIAYLICQGDSRGGPESCIPRPTSPSGNPFSPTGWPCSSRRLRQRRNFPGGNRSQCPQSDEDLDSLVESRRATVLDVSRRLRPIGGYEIDSAWEIPSLRSASKNRATVRMKRISHLAEVWTRGCKNSGHRANRLGEIRYA